MNSSASSTGSLQRAVLEALAYSDIFEHPLQLDELHRYLPVRAEVDELPSVLDSLKGFVESQDDRYFPAGRADVVEIRRRREARSRGLLPHAMRFGRMLGALPFVRMVALTGSLAVLNLSKTVDFDYMLVTAKGRVWTARLFAVALNRLARLLGYTLCPNLIVSETALEWPLHDLYSARELAQMIPITGLGVYRKLMNANAWANMFLPNAYLESGGLPPSFEKRTDGFQKLFEPLLRGKPGDRFEQWEMTRKIARFSKQPGFGEETIFTADLCQGNFHHHRKWTHEIYLSKLSALDAVPEMPRSGPGGDEMLRIQSPKTAIGAIES